MSSNFSFQSLQSKIPASHEVQMQHGSKAVLALAVDPAGARMASGSMDYEVKFWDFQGMDNTCQSFRTMTPCEKYGVCISF
jgi:WD repeat-containing protein 70